MIKQLFYIFFLSLFSVNASNPKPNIIFIFADDIGYEDLNCYGGLDFKTPHLNQMAKEGILFENMYTSPVCTPSRVSLHTGTHTFRHQHHGVLPVHKGTRKKVDFQRMPTFAQEIRQNGYATAVTGKWQLATLEVWPKHIQQAGFDSWCVWQIWHQQQKTDRHWDACLNRDGKVLANIEDQFGPDVLTHYVIEKMTEATRANQPFFILHNELLPHWPIVDTPDDRRLKRTPSMDHMIEYMDKLVGQILKSVVDLGIKEHTYVFFMGDNGLQESYFKNPKFGQAGEKKHTRHTLKGNVDGGKGQLNDAGSHVPLLVWGPSSIPTNTQNSELVDVVDLFSTFCDLTQTTTNIATDGRSIAKQIHGQPGPPREWTHQGLGHEESIFDGSWRYYIHSEQLLDARQLPKERILSKLETVERQPLIHQMKAISQSIKANPPQAPKARSSYK